VDLDRVDLRDPGAEGAVRLTRGIVEAGEQEPRERAPGARGRASAGAGAQ